MFKSINLILLFVAVSFGLELIPPPFHSNLEHIRTARAPPPSCPGENEVYACRTKEETCNYTHRHHFPNPFKSCHNGCYCANGYVRNNTGQCVSRSQFCNNKVKRSIGDDLFNTTNTQELEVLLLDTPVGISYQKGHVHIHF